MGLFLTKKKQQAVYLERDEKGVHLFGPCGTQHDQCSGCGACGQGASAPIEFAGDVPAEVEEGDLCEVEVEGANPMVAGFMLFMLPLGCLVGGAIIGISILEERMGKMSAGAFGGVVGMVASMSMSFVVSKIAASSARGIVSIRRIGEPGA